jgi:hypothetical protein
VSESGKGKGMIEKGQRSDGGGMMEECETKADNAGIRIRIRMTGYLIGYVLDARKDSIVLLSRPSLPHDVTVTVTPSSTGSVTHTCIEQSAL